jgi:hypothetical protein
MAPRGDVSTRTHVGEVVVLEGTWSVDGQPRPDGETCMDEITLDRPLVVLDKHDDVLRDGRGQGAHPIIGDARRVCTWVWNGASPNDAPLIPSGSHVVVRGTPWPPMIGLHPRAVLLFDTDLLSATPPPAPVPPGVVGNGDHVFFVRSVDERTRTLGLDLAFLFYGEAARAFALQHGEPAPASGHAIADERGELRLLVLPPPDDDFHGPARLEPGSGWRTIPLADLVNGKPFLVQVRDGRVRSFKELDFVPR